MGWRKIEKFDTHNKLLDEFSAPTYPSQVRRLNVDYQNNIWWALGGGQAPGQARQSSIRRRAG